MKRTDKILQYVIGPSVLDIGCAGQDILKENSNGWLHGLLSERFPDVVGIDISEEDINRLVDRGIQNLYIQSAEELELPNKFNTIVAGEVIEHLSNPGIFLEKAYKHLRYDGRLIITTPNPFSALHVVYAFFKYPKTCGNDEHTCWFCPSTLRSLLQRYRFQVRYFDYVDDYENIEKFSWRFKIFSVLIQLTGPLLPQRLRSNAMIFVVEKNKSV